MEKKNYSQPMIKVLSMANVCDVDIPMSSGETVYGPPEVPVIEDPSTDLFTK